MKDTPPWAAAIIAVILQSIVLIFFADNLIWDNFLPFLSWGFAFISISLITKSRYKDNLWFSALVAWVILNLLFWLIPSWLKPGWLVLLITLPTAVGLAWRYGVLPELGIKHERIPEPPVLRQIDLLPQKDKAKQLTISGYLPCHVCEAVAMTKTHCLACGAPAKPVEPVPTKAEGVTQKTEVIKPPQTNVGQPVSTTTSEYLPCHACDAVAMTKTHCLNCGTSVKKDLKKGGNRVDVILDL